MILDYPDYKNKIQSKYTDYHSFTLYKLKKKKKKKNEVKR